MKKSIILIFSLATLLFVSCAKEESDIFPASPAERLNNALKVDRDSLINAENGWIMEYFPTPDSAGYTMLVKFDKSGQVIVAGRNKMTGNLLVRDSSLFEMIGDNGPVLTFNTYNKVLHAFSTPENPDGYGLQGDYEFIVMNITTNQIELKGKKRATTILLKKFPQNTTWEKYLSDINTMDNLIFMGTTNTMNFIFGNTKLVAFYGSKHVFRITKQGEDPGYGTNYPFIVTPKGIRLYKAYTYNEQSAQTFELSNDKQQLVCTETGVSAHFESSNMVTYFNSEISAKRKWALVLSDNSMGAPVKTIIDRMKTSLAAQNKSLQLLAFSYDSIRTNVIYLQVKNGTDTISAKWDYTFQPNFKSITYTFKNSYDTNGSMFYISYDGFSDMANLLGSTFSFSAECGLNLSALKLTDTKNPEIWFYIKKQ